MTPANPIAIGIDIGGTRVKSVLIDEQGKILAHDERDSVEGAEQLTSLVHCILDQFDGARACPVGISCPGLAQRDHRAIARMPHRLTGLEKLDFGQALNRDIVVLNDAHAATLGETILGAAAGYKHVVMLTIGTGVGGGVVIDGRLYTGATGRAGHFGHTTVNASGPLDICNMPGSIEDAIGNHNITQRSSGRFASTHQLIEAIQAGDAEACMIWQRSIDALATTIASLINTFDPEAVVIGGGVSAAGDLLFEPLAKAIDRVEWRPFGVGVPVLPAQLGTQAGALGAALFALQPELRS